MNKEDILKQIEDYSAEQLADYINQKVVTLNELKATGNLDATKRIAIIDIAKKKEIEDDHVWSNAQHTEQGCRDYLTKYPSGRHTDEAKQRINKLEALRLKEEAEKREKIERIRQNPNSFTPKMIRDYLEAGVISRSDLINADIPDQIIDCLENISSPILELGEAPEAIPDGYTEVYFWGIPGSGKTCALAAVLSTAEKYGYLEIAQGPGYNYMVQLKNIFSNDLAFLPAASPVDTTQYLPFALKKPNEKYARSVSLIELSGEIFECFLFKNANKPLPSSEHEETFSSLINFLKGNNRKIHFFFIDYDRKNTIDTKGYKQADYLNAAATFFNNKQYDLFKKTTDAIYIVITKSDLIDCPKSERVNQIKQYLKESNFTAFVNSLRTKCRDNSINGKRILATPFALGEVYFKQVCTFDDETSCNIIDILMRRIAPQKQSIIDVFNK